MAYFATGAALTAALNQLPASLTGTYKAFDAFYYAAQYMGSYTGTLSPIEHFVQIGAARGYKPNADFDPAYYQSKYSDLAGLDAADLLFHYVKFGLNEGRAGNATLAAYNWTDYLNAYPAVKDYVAANLSSFGGSMSNGAIAHYVKFGAQQGFTLPNTAGQTFTLTAVAASVEEGGNATFALTLDSAPTSDVTVNYVTATGTAGSSDYTSVSGTVTFAAGQTSQFVTIATTEDSAFEADETFTVTFSGSSLTASVTATGTITNDDVDPSTQAQTYTLTTGADNVRGTTGNDTIDGYDLNTVSNTLSTADVIDGGAGTDTLVAYLPTASSNLTPNMSNVENVTVTADGTTVLNLTQSTGVTSLTNQNSSQQVTFSNIGSTNVALNVVDQDSTATIFTFKASAVSGAADTASLTLNNAVASAVTINSVETLNIASTGATNSITLTADSAGTIAVSGDQNLTLSGTLATTVTKVDAAAMTGALTATLGAAGSPTVTVTVNGGAGNDDLTVSAVANKVSVAAGAGNDRIVANTNLAADATADVIDGGDGTDTLVTTYTLANGYVTPATRTITNIETLEISDQFANAGSVSTRALDTGITKVVLANAGATGGTATVAFNAGASTLDIGIASPSARATTTARLAGTTTVTAFGSATDDAVTIKNANAVTSTQDAFNGQAIAAGSSTAGVETLTLNTGTTVSAADQTVSTVTITPTTGVTSTKLSLAGTNKLTASGVITATEIDGSAMGTGGSLIMANVANTATKITGTAGNDTLYAAASASTVDGGAGRDSIVGGASADALSGGAGNDSITSGGGNDTISGGDGNDSLTLNAAGSAASIDGGAGNDTIALGDYVATGQKIAGGDGDDTVSMTNTSVGALNSASVASINTLNANISGIEYVDLSSGLAAQYDVGRFGNISKLIVSGITGAQSIIGLGATNEITLKGALGATLSTVLADATGAADALNYKLSTTAATTNFGTVSFGSGAAANVESATIYVEDTALTASPNATPTLVDDTLALTANSKLTTLTVNGNAAATADVASKLTLTTSGATGLTTFDASAAKYAVVYAANSTGNVTMTGGTGADSLTGGVGNDSLTGGSGNDTLTGGEGADVLTGGSGIDTIALAETTAVSDTVVFGATAATNGSDVITGFKVGSTAAATGGDVLNLSAYLPSATVADASGATGIQAYASTSDAAVALANKIAIVTKAAAWDADGIAAVFGSAKPFTLAANGKAVVLAVNTASASTVSLYGIENDSTSTVLASEVKLLGTITLTTDYVDGAVVAANFGL